MNKVAAIQLCSTPDLDENLRQTAVLIAKAADAGAMLVVLPEMFALFGIDEQAKWLIREQPGSGKIQDFLASMSQKHKVWLVGGTIPLACDDKKRVRAACLVFNAAGEQVGRYDKIHLFDATLSTKETYKESATVAPGTQTTVIDTPVGRLGLCVCYDLRFPALFIDLAKQGVDLIASPSAFTAITGQAHWILLARSRAIDTLAYFIGACQGGFHANGRQTYGHSLVVDAWGVVLDQCGAVGPDIAYGEVDREALSAIRRALGSRQILS